MQNSIILDIHTDVDIIYPPIIASQNSIAVLDQIRAVDKNRFKDYIETLTVKELTAMGDGLREVLVLPQ